MNDNDKFKNQSQIGQIHSCYSALKVDFLQFFEVEVDICY